MKLFIMRSNNPIKVTMKIPFSISKPDRNGIIYTKKAIENMPDKEIDNLIKLAENIMEALY